MGEEEFKRRATKSANELLGEALKFARLAKSKHSSLWANTKPLANTKENSPQK